MLINFYNNYEERIKVTKTLGDSPFSREGTLREGCSVVAPSILVEKTDSTIFDYNYAYIKEFGRYYFIDDIVSENAHLWRINMSVDVLMTYGDGIRNVTALVTRNENSTDYTQNNEIIFTQYDKEVTETTMYGTTAFNVTADPTQYILTYYTNSDNARYYDKLTQNIPSRGVGMFKEISASKLGNTASAHTSIIGVDKDLEHFDKGIGTLAQCVALKSELAGFIASCIVFPFDVPYMTDSSGSQIYYDLYLGTNLVQYSPIPTKTTNVDAYEPLYQACPIINIAEFTLTGDTGTFLDYDPYTTYELYLPYKGWITLDPNICLNKKIRVDYTCELTSVTGQVQVYTLEGEASTLYASSKLLYEGDCQLGIEIPFTTTDNQERTNNIATSVVSNAIKLLPMLL